MSGVGAPLPMKVHRGVAPVAVVRGRGSVSRLEALEARSRLDQRAVHGEVLVRQQASPVRRQDHLIGELLTHSVLQQPLPVLREHRGVEAALHQVHAQEPAEQQIVVQLLTEGAPAPHRVERNQQGCLQQALGRDGRPPHGGVHPVELGRQPGQGLIGQGLDGAERVIGWISKTVESTVSGGGGHGRNRTPAPAHVGLPGVENLVHHGGASCRPLNG